MPLALPKFKLCRYYLTRAQFEHSQPATDTAPDVQRDEAKVRS